MEVKMSNKPASNKYVILQNTSTSPKVITDHRGTLQKMKRGEYKKIFIEEGEGEQLAFRKYASMKAIPGLIVTFSSNIEIAPKISKLFVRSNKDADEATAKRVDVIRKSVQEDARAKNMGAAHLARVKAEQNLKAKGMDIKQPATMQAPAFKGTGVDETLDESEVGPVEDENIEPIEEVVKPKREAKAKSKVAELEEEEETGLTADIEEVLDEAGEIPGEESILEEGKGIALTSENLLGMTKAAVIDVAKQLEMEIDESVDKKDIIKAILKKVG
jgi:hypothetical protein